MARDWRIFKWRRDGRKAIRRGLYDRLTATRIRNRLRRRGHRRARVEQIVLPAWRTHLTGNIGIPKGVPRHVRRNAKRLRSKVGKAFKDAGMVGHVNSFVRTYAEQKALYEKYGPGRAAKPGTSFHELGYAIDITDPDGDTADGRHAIESHLKRHGLHTPLGHEDWHITEENRWG